MATFENVFKHFNIGSLKIPNRILFPPMVTNYATPDGFVTPKLTSHLKKRVAGGAGLVIVENTAVNQEGRLFPNQHIDDDRFLPGLEDMFSAIKGAGARAFIQLDHEGRETNTKATGGKGPVAPSPIPSTTFKEMPREMTKEDIDKTIDDFVSAAKRAKRAGADGIELQGAHGFLIAQFLSPHANRRTDEYGGKLQNRTRFALQIITHIKEACGEDYPIIFRFSGDEFLPDGLNLEESIELARILTDTGVDALHVSAGTLETAEHICPGEKAKPGTHVYLAEAVKKAVDIPVIAVGKIPDLKLAEEIISSGRADAVAMGRALLADPDLPTKSKKSEFENIIPCLWCNYCLEKILSSEPDVACRINPEVGKEI